MPIKLIPYNEVTDKEGCCLCPFVTKCPSDIPDLVMKGCNNGYYREVSDNEPIEQTIPVEEDKLTLLDQFAMAAFPVLFRGDATDKLMAEWAYRIATAMMEERKKYSDKENQ